jgi:hypothetical protein
MASLKTCSWATSAWTKCRDGWRLLSFTVWGNSQIWLLRKPILMPPLNIFMHALSVTDFAHFFLFCVYQGARASKTTLQRRHADDADSSFSRRAMTAIPMGAQVLGSAGMRMVVETSLIPLRLI